MTVQDLLDYCTKRATNEVDAENEPIDEGENNTAFQSPNLARFYRELDRVCREVASD